MTSIEQPNLDPVERLLIGLCRRDAASALAAADLEQLSCKSFRNQLSRLAARHRVAGLMLVALREHPGWAAIPKSVADEILQPGDGDVEPAAGLSGELPRSVAERVRSFEVLVSKAQAKDQELERLLGLLRGERLEPVVLKGPALRCTVYAHPVERQYSDFDLLLPAEQVDHAIDVVTAAGYAFPYSPEKLKGYRDLHFHVILRQLRRFRAEIHWGLSKAASPFQLDAKAVLRACVPAASAQGSRMLIPCPEHMLLHMAHENVRDWFARLSRIVDLDRIVAASPGLDWDCVVSQAREGGLQSLLALSLGLSRDLLGTSLASDVLASLRPGAATRLHLGLMRPAPSLMRQSFRRVGGSASALQFWLSAGSRNRRRALLRILSGSQAREGWIFRESDQAPPRAFAAIVAGLKSGLQFAGHHARLYSQGLRVVPLRGWHRS